MPVTTTRRSSRSARAVVTHRSAPPASDWSRGMMIDSVASTATSPSTLATAAARPNMPRSFSSSTSRRSVSPGCTRRRKRQSSMPAKRPSLPRYSSRVSTATPPVCASASTISTPGMIGRPGKCPVNCGSLAVTFLIADRPLARLQLDHAVDEQERIAVREDPHDVGRLERQAGGRHRFGHWLRHAPTVYALPATKAAGPTRSSRLVLTSRLQEGGVVDDPTMEGEVRLHAADLELGQGASRARQRDRPRSRPTPSAWPAASRRTAAPRSRRTGACRRARPARRAAAARRPRRSAARSCRRDPRR